MVENGLSYAIGDTGAGWIGLLGSARGLASATFPQNSPEEARQLLGSRVNHAQSAPQMFEGILGRLRMYFASGKASFPDKLDLTGVTPFQQEVLEKARLIPYGETRSYGWLAGQVGRPRAARAAGQALGKNPLPVIIPCHRVLASGGRLGGYRGGAEMKRYLLSLETPPR